MAGPGRRKSNSEAIGKWSKYTKKKWQPWDLRYLHVAKTPVRTLNNIWRFLRLESLVQKQEQAKNVSDHAPEETLGQPHHHSKALAASAAKWLVFLDEVGLARLELSDLYLEACLADYLPGDLLAAPALIELQLAYSFIIFFYDDFRVLRTDSKYPVLMGRHFQFEVRQHPTLGSVATFSKYHQNPRKILRESMTSTRLSLIYQQAKGIIPVSVTPISMEGDTQEEKLMQAKEYSRFKEAEVAGEIDFSYQTRLPWLALGGHWSFCSCREAAHQYGQRCGRAATPLSSIPAIFEFFRGASPQSTYQINTRIIANCKPKC